MGNEETGRKSKKETPAPSGAGVLIVDKLH